MWSQLSCSQTPSMTRLASSSSRLLRWGEGWSDWWVCCRTSCWSAKAVVWDSRCVLAWGPEVDQLSIGQVCIFEHPRSPCWWWSLLLLREGWKVVDCRRHCWVACRWLHWSCRRFASHGRLAWRGASHRMFSEQTADFGKAVQVRLLGFWRRFKNCLLWFRDQTELGLYDCDNFCERIHHQGQADHCWEEQKDYAWWSMWREGTQTISCPCWSSCLASSAVFATVVCFGEHFASRCKQS